MASEGGGGGSEFGGGEASKGSGLDFAGGGSEGNTSNFAAEPSMGSVSSFAPEPGISNVFDPGLASSGTGLGAVESSFTPEASGASPWTVESPVQTEAFSYLNDPGAASFQPGSTLAASNAAGQPFAAGGTTAVSGGTTSIDPVSASAPVSGTGAASLAPAASAASGATPADPTSSWSEMLKKGLTSNPLGTAISAAGLGYNIMQGQKTSANQAALSEAAAKAAGNNAELTKAGIAQVGTNQTNAAEIGAKGKELEQYLTTGQLPQQYSQQVDQAIQDAKTTAISNAAKNGQPTDPTKNTALAQQLAQIDGQRAAMTSKVAETLFNAGAGLTNTAANVGNASASSLLSGGQNAANLSGQLYTTLTGIDSKQSEQTAKAIAALAASLNGGTQKKASV